MIRVDTARLRGTLGDIATAGPELSLAVTCCLAFFVPEIEARFGPRIGLIIGLEFVGLHAFGFAGRIALAKPTRRWQQVLRIPAFVAICIVYSLIVADWGEDAVMSFWVVTLSTYAGLFIHDAPEQRKQTLLWRWLVSFMVFMAAGIVAGLTAEYFNLRSPRKEFLFGFLFFATLGVCDLARLYDRLANMRASTL